MRSLLLLSFFVARGGSDATRDSSSSSDFPSCLFTNASWNASAPTAPFHSECFAPRSGPALCAALAARGIRRVLFVGDSTVSNLFGGAVYDVLPREGAMDDAPGQTTPNPLPPWRGAFPGDNHRCRYCKGARTHGTNKGIYPARRYNESECAFARRCDGHLELESWRAGNEDPAQNALLAASLAELRASGALPDAVVFSLGAHYMGAADHFVRFSRDLEEATGLLLARRAPEGVCACK